MKKFTLIVLVLYSLAFSQAYSSSWNQDNMVAEMMRSMLQMFLLMNLNPNFSADSSWSPDKYQSPQLQTLPPIYWQNTEPVDGAWISDQDTVLVVYNGIARIYSSNNAYQNYFVEIRPGWLQIKDAASGAIQRFEMRLSERRMVLRNREGQLVRFIKIANYSLDTRNEVEGMFQYYPNE